ncbi:hypothetical protein HYFRA_00011322 [Hymenoscyphus fraxineus]|uniref:Uncharacterized protein n=1 Tax=Hymenoscyphus fraxineus TaxID=746836 RepID=A0A9N9KYZ5_9HELO|nr:hypothetical protein HYFRA_00011322 [Hymenoscyphus fraxineus]
MSTTASSQAPPAPPARATTEPAPTKTTPDYDQGFKAGVKSQEARMQAQKERFREKIEELKREVKNLRGRVESMDGRGSAVGTPRVERPQPRMGVVRRESIAEHELRIKNVERSFGI